MMFSSFVSGTFPRNSGNSSGLSNCSIAVLKNITRQLQTISVSGTVKIMKTFMGFTM